MTNHSVINEWFTNAHIQLFSLMHMVLLIFFFYRINIFSFMRHYKKSIQINLDHNFYGAIVNKWWTLAILEIVAKGSSPNS